VRRWRARERKATQDRGSGSMRGASAPGGSGNLCGLDEQGLCFVPRLPLSLFPLSNLLLPSFLPSCLPPSLPHPLTPSLFQRISPQSNNPRIRKELSDCSPTNGSGVSAVAINGDIHRLNGTIKGSEDTPYEGGIFSIDIIIPEGYPFEPPKMKVSFL